MNNLSLENVGLELHATEKPPPGHYPSLYHLPAATEISLLPNINLPPGSHKTGMYSVQRRDLPKDNHKDLIFSRLSAVSDSTYIHVTLSRVNWWLENRKDNPKWHTWINYVTCSTSDITWYHATVFIQHSTLCKEGVSNICRGRKWKTSNSGACLDS